MATHEVPWEAAEEGDDPVNAKSREVLLEGGVAPDGHEPAGLCALRVSHVRNVGDGAVRPVWLTVAGRATLSWSVCEEGLERREMERRGGSRKGRLYTSGTVAAARMT